MVTGDGVEEACMIEIFCSWHIGCSVKTILESNCLEILMSTTTASKA